MKNINKTLFVNCTWELLHKVVREESCVLTSHKLVAVLLNAGRYTTLRHMRMHGKATPTSVFDGSAAIPPPLGSAFAAQFHGQGFVKCGLWFSWNCLYEPYFRNECISPCSSCTRPATLSGVIYLAVSKILSLLLKCELPCWNIPANLLSNTYSSTLFSLMTFTEVSAHATTQIKW